MYITREGTTNQKLLCYSTMTSLGYTRSNVYSLSYLKTGESCFLTDELTTKWYLKSISSTKMFLYPSFALLGYCHKLLFFRIRIIAGAIQIKLVYNPSHSNPCFDHLSSTIPGLSTDESGPRPQLLIHSL